MLIISNEEHYKKEIDEAKKNGSWERRGDQAHTSLRSNLEYLHLYGGIEDPALFRVTLGWDHSGFSIIWHRRAGDHYRFFMNGGLIYHQKTGEWSVNT